MVIVMIALKDLITDSKLSFIPKRPSQNVKSIKSSIEEDGLLNPLIVIRRKNKYVVLDGQKRLSALRELSRSKLFKRALYKIPCLVDVPSFRGLERRRPYLLSAQELAHKILVETQKGMSAIAVAQRFECDLSVVEDAKSLPKLHPKILKSFNNNALSLAQASAFATISNQKAQWTLLLQLGPFVSNTAIIDSIKSGQAVLNLPNGEVIILPSQPLPRKAPRLDTKPTHQNYKLLAA